MISFTQTPLSKVHFSGFYNVNVRLVQRKGPPKSVEDSAEVGWHLGQYYDQLTRQSVNAVYPGLNQCPDRTPLPKAFVGQLSWLAIDDERGHQAQTLQTLARQCQSPKRTQRQKAKKAIQTLIETLHPATLTVDELEGHYTFEADPTT